MLINPFPRADTVVDLEPILPKPWTITVSAGSAFRRCAAHVYFGMCHSGSKCSTNCMEWEVFKGFTTSLIYRRNPWVGGRRDVSWRIDIFGLTDTVFRLSPWYSEFESLHISWSSNFWRMFPFWNGAWLLLNHGSYNCVHSYVQDKDLLIHIFVLGY